MSTARNPGNYDEEGYLHSIKVAGKIITSEIEITAYDKDEISVYTKQIQTALCRQIDNIAVNEDKGTLKAMLFGYKDDISKDVKDKYKSAGILHLISLSGLHIAAIGEIIFKLFRRKFQYYISAFFSGIIMVLFSIVVGGSVSTIRAVIMFSIALVARLLGLRYDIKSSLALAVLLMVIYNPFYVYNTSFQLSVMAIVAIGYLYSEIEKILKRHFFNKIIGSFFVSLSITITTIPILSSIYFEISTYSVIVNILVIPLMTIILLMGIMAVIFSGFSTIAGMFFIGTDIYILKIYDFICELVKKLPMNTISVAKMSKMDTYVYYGILIAIVLILKLVNKSSSHLSDILPDKIKRICTKNIKKDYNFKIIYGVIISLLLICLVLIISKKNNTLITFLDVGQGDCAFINIDDTTILIDGGSSDLKNIGKNRIVPTIKAYGYSYLDIVIVSHTDNDHISGIVEIIENKMLEIGCVYIPDVNGIESMDDFIEVLEKNNIPFKRIKEGSYIKFNRGYLQSLSPNETLQGDINDKSLVIYFNIKNIKGIFTGDISSAVEPFIIKKYSSLLENIDVLKVAHHGAKTSSGSEFINTLKPDIAVISCGINNSYNHPHIESIKRLENVVSSILITKEKGAIFINFEGKNLLTDTYL